MKKKTVKKSKRPVRKKVARKKIVRKKPVSKKPVSKKPAPQKTAKVKKEKSLGEVTHYFPKVRAAVILLKETLSVGDTIRIKGHTTDFKQTITSMQIDHEAVPLAKKGTEIGLLVNARVREGDVVTKA